MARSTREVLEDHLRLALEGTFAKDIQRNFSPDVVILSSRGVHRGHDGAMELADLLEKELPDAPYRYGARIVEGPYAFIEWTARGGGRRVEDGTDSFVVQDGQVVAQTIHYTVLPD